MKEFLQIWSTMNEIKQYDEAAHKFYGLQDIVGLPLISWDQYGAYFNTACKNYEDIVSLQQLAKNNKWAYHTEFEAALFDKKSVIVVTDVKLTIVHATSNISSMNGYLPKEILGQKPNLFQGPKTCMETAKRIRTAIINELPFEETVVNYRKNGSAYNCWIKGEPIFDTAGKLVNFVAYEKEVA